jgi:hypothetical protein
MEKRAGRAIHEKRKGNKKTAKPFYSIGEKKRT